MKKIFSMLLLVCVMVTAQVCSADVKYRAKTSGYGSSIMTYVLAHNNFTATGEYLIKDELDTILYTFDYDKASNIFTVYKEDGSLVARRKFENKFTMHNRQVDEDFTGTYRKGNDGVFRKVGDNSYYIYPYFTDGALIFLDRDGNI